MTFGGHVVVGDLEGIEYTDERITGITIRTLLWTHEPHLISFKRDFLEQNGAEFIIFEPKVNFGQIRICRTVTPRMSFKEARKCVEKKYPIPPTTTYTAANVAAVRCLYPDNISKDAEAFIIGDHKIAVKVPGSPYGFGDWMIGEWSK